MPWIGIKDAVDNHGRVIDSTYQEVSETGLANSSARLLPAQTVCLSRTASVGFVVVMGRPMATSQDFVNWVCGPELNPQFLKYVLVSEREALMRFASGTTHQTIYYPEAKAFHVSLPPRAIQDEIVALAGALDEKIDLNHRMNTTLEAMARALFQSWFVDFDPVRAKMEGRAPAGMDAATAALFPERLVESELGLVPEGWEVVPLGTVCTLKRGHDLPAAQREPGTVPVISSSGVSGTHSEFRARGPGIVTGRYGTIGKVYFCTEDFWPLNTTLFVEDFKGSPPRFLFHVLERVDYLKYSDKAAVPGVNRNHLHEALVVKPPHGLRGEFAEAIRAWWDRVQANERESRTLTTLRDTLLPKLLSGELQVRDLPDHGLPGATP